MLLNQTRRTFPVPGEVQFGLFALHQHLQTSIRSFWVVLVELHAPKLYPTVDDRTSSRRHISLRSAYCTVCTCLLVRCHGQSVEVEVVLGLETQWELSSSGQVSLQKRRCLGVSNHRQ